MMRSAIRLVVAAAVLLSGTLAQATYYPSYYYPPVVVQQKVVKQIVFELTPVYAVGYAAPAVAVSPAPAVPHAPTCADDVKSLRAELERLKAALAAPGKMPAVPDAPPEAPAPAAPKTPMLTQKCAGCHGAAVAGAKGKGLALFADSGEALPWGAELTGKVLKEVASGRMPKGGKLSQEEFGRLAQEIFDLSSR